MKAHINSIEIAYEDHGIGLPVIFLHAFPLNRTMWSHQITSLLDEARLFRFIALDWRGFGESSSGDDSVVSMELLADDLAGLMDTLEIEQAVLCGLSMGGYVAFAFLRKYPQRVAGLILADTRPGDDTPEGRAGREQLAQMVLTKGTEAVADLQIPRLLSPQTRQQQPAVEIGVRRMIATATSQGIAAASRGMALRADATDLLPRITCPTLTIVGSHDTVTPPQVVATYAHAIPDVRLAEIPHAGHLSNLEQPEAFQEALLDFLLTVR